MVMTLKEKLCEPFDGLRTETADKLEHIADDYAIKFFEWTMDYCVEFYDSTERGSIYKFSNHDNKYTNKELLEMFKKQKGLNFILS